MHIFPRTFKIRAESLSRERRPKMYLSRQINPAPQWGYNSYKDQRWKSALVEHPWFQMHLYPSGHSCIQSFLGFPKSADSSPCLKELELDLSLVTMHPDTIQITLWVWDYSSCLFRKDKGQQRSPPNLNKSWQYRAIPSISEVKFLGCLPLTLYYLSSLLVHLSVCSFYSYFGCAVNCKHHQYTFP